MRDPYSVLGVSPNAGDDEIKKAYRKLSRMYHPDTNINNPNKKLAEEKFKEVQAAYDKIMDDREKGGSSYNSYSRGSSGSGYGNYEGNRERSRREYDDEFGYGYGNRRNYSGYSSQGDADSPKIKAAVSFINKGMFSEALNVLESAGGSERNARWFFVRAHAYYGMGNIILAKESIQTAVNMDPGNVQYREFLNQVNQNAAWYAGNSNNPYSTGRRKTCSFIGELICIGLMVGCQTPCCYRYRYWEDIC